MRKSARVGKVRNSFIKHHGVNEKVEPIIAHGKFMWRMTRAWLGTKPGVVLAHYRRIR